MLAANTSGDAKARTPADKQTVRNMFVIVATAVNWKQEEDVIIAGSVPNEEAKLIFGDWNEPKPYISVVPQPT